MLEVEHTGQRATEPLNKHSLGGCTIDMPAIEQESTIE